MRVGAVLVGMLLLWAAISHVAADGPSWRFFDSRPSAAAQHQPERRTALVIGISEYESFARLPNATRDAKAFAELLERYGFEVTLVTNAPYGILRRSLREFRQKSRGAKLALSVFFGHGGSAPEALQAQSMLVPSDGLLDCETKNVVHSIPLSDVAAAMGDAEERVLIVDACRANAEAYCRPIVTSRASSTNAVRSLSPLRGPRDLSVLGRPSVTAPSPTDAGLLIILSTAPERFASDGEPGMGSPFANELLQLMQAHPGRPFLDLFNLAARRVRLATEGNIPQVPQVHVNGGTGVACLKGFEDQCEGYSRGKAYLGSQAKAPQVWGFQAERPRYCADHPDPPKTWSYLPLREAPGVDFQTIDRIPKGYCGFTLTGARKVAEGRVWMQVEFERQSGWVNGDYVQPMRW